MEGLETIDGLLDEHGIVMVMTTELDKGAYLYDVHIILIFQLSYVCQWIAGLYQQPKQPPLCVCLILTPLFNPMWHPSIQCGRYMCTILKGEGALDQQVSFHRVLPQRRGGQVQGRDHQPEGRLQLADLGEDAESAQQVISLVFEFL